MPVFTSSIEVTADYPTIKPSLNLNFARSRALDPRITFERGSVGTYVGRDGLIKTVGEDEPRFDHDPVTLESLGLLIEESRTNLAEYGTIVGDSNGWYNRPAFNTAINNAISPDGTQNATLLTNLNAESDPDLYSFEQYNIGSDKTITHSIYVKSPDAANVGKEINFRGKRTVGTASSWGQKFILTAEWQRVSVTHTYQADNTQGRAYIGADPNTTDPAGAATGCLFWGLQVEEGGYASSFIPTSGSTVTRAKDTATILGGNFNSFYNPNEWTVDFVYRIRTVEPNGSNYRLWDINNNTNDGRLGALYSVNGFVSYFGFENGTTSFSSNDSGFTIIVNDEYHGALAYSPTSSIAFKPQAGVLGNEDTNVPLDGPTQLQIGDWYNNDRSMNGTIAKFVYYPKRLTNAQLLTITS